MSTLVWPCPSWCICHWPGTDSCPVYIVSGLIVGGKGEGTDLLVGLRQVRYERAPTVFRQSMVYRAAICCGVRSPSVRYHWETPTHMFVMARAASRGNSFSKIPLAHPSRTKLVSKFCWRVRAEICSSRAVPSKLRISLNEMNATSRLYAWKRTKHSINRSNFACVSLGPSSNAACERIHSSCIAV